MTPAAASYLESAKLKAQQLPDTWVSDIFMDLINFLELQDDALNPPDVGPGVGLQSLEFKLDTCVNHLASIKSRLAPKGP